MKSLAVGSGIVVVMLLLLSGCECKDYPLSVSEDVDPVGGGGTGRVVLNVTYATPEGGAAKLAAVDTMTAYVYERDGTEITHVNLEKVEDRGTASITVTVGNDRQVDVLASETGLVCWLGSDGDVDVAADQTTTADVVMKTFVPMLTVPASPDTDGEYKLSWTPVEGAGKYTVQEISGQPFPAAGAIVPIDLIRTIYEGTATSAAVTGREDGTYWYRVWATGDYGRGRCCDALSVEVQIPPASGTIDIDVPWPK